MAWSCIGGQFREEMERLLDRKVPTIACLYTLHDGDGVREKHLESQREEEEEEEEGVPRMLK